MFQQANIPPHVFARYERFVNGVRFAAAQPNWLTRAVVWTFLLVVGLPILLLLALAVIASMLVFFVLFSINAVLRRISGAIPQHDGRENVRVIQRLD